MNLKRDILIIEVESTPHSPQFQEIPKAVGFNLSTVNEAIQILLIPLHHCLYLSKSRYGSKRIEHSMGKRDASMSWLNHFCDWINVRLSHRTSHWTTVTAWNLSTDLSLTLRFLASHQLRHIHYRLVRLCLYSSLSSHLFFSMISLLSPLFTIHFGTQFSFISKLIMSFHTWPLSSI